MGRIEVRGDTSRETQIDGYATPPPPLRKAKGDASTASRGMPVIHPNTPHVIPQAHVIPATPTSFPRTREPREKHKHATLPPKQPTRPSSATPLGAVRNNVSLTPPLRSAKGDASAASRGMPVIHRSTPATSFPRTREPSEKQSTPFPTPHPKNRIISLFPNLYPNLKQSPVPAHIWYFPTVLPTFT